MELKPGWYWVKWHEALIYGWEPAEYDGRWFAIGNQGAQPTPVVIGPRIEPPEEE